MLSPIPLEWMLIPLVSLLAGVILTRRQKREGHLVRCIGWSMFGVYWFFWGPYFAAMHDYINSLATFGALPVMLFLAYHEYLCYKWDEEYEPLRFAAMASGVAGIGFYMVYTIEPLAKGLIICVGLCTVWILNLLQPGYSLGAFGVSPEGDYAVPVLFHAPHIGSDVNIVVACTAIQAIIVAGSFILPVRAPITRRVKTFLAVGIPTFFLNLVRNVLVIYLVYNGITDFETAHALIGKIAISLIGFFALMLLAFSMLPEFYLTINGLFDLPWRKNPGHDYRKHVGRVVNRLFSKRA